MQIYSSKNIFFQYVNRNIIITDCFLSVEIFNFPNNIDLFNGINRTEVSLIYILYCCNAGASVRQDILSGSGLMSFRSWNLRRKYNIWKATVNDLTIFWLFFTVIETADFVFSEKSFYRFPGFLVVTSLFHIN